MILSGVRYSVIGYTMSWRLVQRLPKEGRLRYSKPLDGRHKDYGGTSKMRLVLKVFKKGYSLVDLQRLWPPGMALDTDAFPRRYIFYDCFDVSYVNNLIWPKGVHLLDDGRFAFIFDRCTSDRRKLIDHLMLGSNGRGPPFSRHHTIHSSIELIAQGMYFLHEMGILHNDLKAANVLVDHEFDEDIAQGFIADFESSKGVVGTRFWRAPEILLAVKNRNMRREICTKQTNVYSFAMTCYVVITGRIPFEDHDVQDYDIVLRGERPTLPDDPPYSLYNNLVTKCWHQDPRQRPSFVGILKELKLLRPRTYVGKQAMARGGYFPIRKKVRTSLKKRGRNNA